MHGVSRRRRIEEENRKTREFSLSFFSYSVFLREYSVYLRAFFFFFFSSSVYLQAVPKGTAVYSV